jgi:hypothetical protein
MPKLCLAHQRRRAGFHGARAPVKEMSPLRLCVSASKKGFGAQTRRKLATDLTTRGQRPFPATGRLDAEVFSQDHQLTDVVRVVVGQCQGFF